MKKSSWTIALSGNKVPRMNFKGLFFIRSILVCFLILFGISYISYARTIRIPGQYSSIQEAIDLAWNGDTILISKGRYFESINLRGKAITVGSYYLLDGDTTHISNTIIDGSRSGGNDSYSTIRMISGEDTLSVIKGLTITGGRGSLVYAGESGHWGGGGILVFNSGGKIESNIIEGNSLSYELEVNTGAGILASVGNGKNFIVRNNIIRDNIIRTVQQVDGGGLIVAGNTDSYSLIEMNQIIRNSIRSSGPNSAHGGGLSLFCNIPFRNKIIVRKNTIAFNEASSNPGSDNIKAWGGGINVMYVEEVPEFHGTEIPIVISDNHIHHNSSSEKGGGIAFYRVNGKYLNQPDCPSALVIKNRIIDNTSPDGAGISNVNASIVLINNTLNNISSGNKSSEIFNRDIHYNFINSGIINAFENDIQGQWRDEKNIFHDVFPIVNTFSHSWRVTEYSDEGIKFSLIPPSWRRWWALLIYGAILLIGLLWYRKYIIHRISMSLALKNEKQEKEHIRELERMKSKFFANISHEFKTPLALIYGPVNEILQEEKISEKGRKHLQYVKGSVERLRQLINQLLELSKLESGTVKLQVHRGNLKEFTNGIANSFLSLAECKKIDFQVHLSDNLRDAFFDSDKLEKILINLLSNAFKFLSEGGKIKLGLEYSNTDSKSSKQFVTITVSDTGPGMSEEAAGRIFERFYSNESANKSDQAGTGLGLSLVKELVDIYRGTIEVKSRLGEGTVIGVNLPVDKEMFSMEEIHTAPYSETNLPNPKKTEQIVYETESLLAENHENDTKDSPVILIVEDNNDLRSYIASLLNSDARILEAENGKYAFKIAIETIPDLIISDLMMPMMDGLELIHLLRDNEHTSHIPFIMLTARDGLESKIESFEKGVDEYIGKPFHPEELKARVSNMIVQRQILRAHYRKEFIQDPDVYMKRNVREDFMDRVVLCIKTNLSNPEFSVVMLSEALHMSRVQLYRKISAMTGFSPVELIRNIRLKVASKMFRENELNVSQVMFEVGFSTPSYFTECFRELFGSNPSEFIKKAKEEIASSHIDNP